MLLEASEMLEVQAELYSPTLPLLNSTDPTF